MARRESGGGSAALPLVLVLLVLAAGGGIWWYMNHRTNPKEQADKFLTAMKKQDWKAAYEVVEVDKAEFPNAQAYHEKMEANFSSTPMGGAIKDVLQSVDYKTEEPKVDGGEATVPVQLTASVFGQTINQKISLKLKNFGGVWKVAQENRNVPGLGNLSALGNLTGVGR